MILGAKTRKKSFPRREPSRVTLSPSIATPQAESARFHIDVLDAAATLASFGLYFATATIYFALAGLQLKHARVGLHFTDYLVPSCDHCLLTTIEVNLISGVTRSMEPRILKRCSLEPLNWMCASASAVNLTRDLEATDRPVCLV